MKRYNYASVTAVFADGSRSEWTTKPTAKFAGDAELFAVWLSETAEGIRQAAAQTKALVESESK